MNVRARLMCVLLMIGLTGCPEQSHLAAANHDDSADSNAANASLLDERKAETLIDVVALDASEGGCEAGGVEVRSGKDADGDGELSSDEVERTSRVCNGETGATGADGANGSDGADGADGSDGANGEDGSDGANGEDGSDGADGADGNDGANGQDGLTSLVRVSAAKPSATCPGGGSLVETGVDVNGDGSLADEEVDSSALICNGINGKNGKDARQLEAEPLAPVDVSASSTSGEWSPSLALTSDEAGWWSELDWASEEQWLRYDFGAPVFLTQVRAYAREGYEGINPTIQGSHDGVTWTDLTVLGADGVEQGPWEDYTSFDQSISTDVAYRYARLHFDFGYVYYAWLELDGTMAK